MAADGTAWLCSRGETASFHPGWGSGGLGSWVKVTMYQGAPTCTPSHRHPKTIGEHAKRTQAPYLVICCQCWLALTLLPLVDMIWSSGHHRTHHLGERA